MRLPSGLALPPLIVMSIVVPFSGCSLGVGVAAAVGLSDGVAVSVGDEVRATAGRVRSAIDSSFQQLKSVPPRLVWVAPQGLHVTLRFLGEAESDHAVAALAVVEAASCEATLGPQVSRLGRSFLVVPVSGLDELAAAVVRATGAIGQPPEPRPFTGHLTVARLKNRGACRVAGAPISGSFPVTEIALMRSHLHREGARYEVVATKALT